MKHQALINQNLPKNYLTSLKSDIYKLHICELQTARIDFSSLCNTLKEDAIKKAKS